MTLSPLHLYLVCGERTGAVVLWLPSHHPSRCCTLVVVEKRPPHMIVKRFGCTAIHNKKRYINASFIHSYGIRSLSHAAWIASYETTSALVTLPSPEMGVAPRYNSHDHHADVSPLFHPLDRPCLSTGRSALRTCVPACCCHNGCLRTGWGATCNGQAASGLWTGP